MFTTDAPICLNSMQNSGYTLKKGQTHYLKLILGQIEGETMIYNTGAILTLYNFARHLETDL